MTELFVSLQSNLPAFYIAVWYALATGVALCLLAIIAGTLVVGQEHSDKENGFERKVIATIETRQRVVETRYNCGCRLVRGKMKPCPRHAVKKRFAERDQA